MATAFDFFDVINPAMYMSPLLATILISLILTFIMTFIYKWMTNQKELKELKDQQKKYSDEIKKCKNDTKKMGELNKKMMSLSMESLKKTMKPTLITFIPMFLILAWLNSSLLYHPIQPNQDFTTTIYLNEGVIGSAEISTSDGLQIIGDANKSITNTTVSWTLRGNKGEHVIEYRLNGQSCGDCRKNVIITSKQKYANPVQYASNSGIKKITIDNNPLKVIWKLSWVWVYLIISIALSLSLRKLLKIY